MLVLSLANIGKWLSDVLAWRALTASPLIKRHSFIYATSLEPREFDMRQADKAGYLPRPPPTVEVQLRGPFWLGACNEL